MKLPKSCILVLGLLLGAGLIGCADKPEPVAEQDTPSEPTADRNRAKDARLVELETAVAAWKKAGADLVWKGVNEYGEMTPRPSVDATPTFLCLDIPSESLRGLPQPDTPFAVDFDYTDDAQLKELAGLTQLQWLDVAGSHVTDAGLKELVRLKQLQRLHVRSTNVTKGGLKELAGLTQLQWLDVAGSHVTDAGLKELVRLKQLQRLHVRSTNVTKGGLKVLAGLKQLQWLNLYGTKVTDAGLKELKEALPGCTLQQIIWPD